MINLGQELPVIWSALDYKSSRYEINRAEREGIRIVRNENYSDFDQLNRAFRKQKGLKGVTNIKYIRKYGTLLQAFQDKTLLAGQVYLEDRDNIRWLIGASRRLESKSPLIGCANRALIWEAIKYAKAKGIREFDFGGYHLGEDPQLQAINSFKRSFGGKLVMHHVYQKDYSPLLHVAKEAAKWM